MARNITVDSIRIQRFGCVQNVDMKLSPIHALIGPNDSGKSTILRAVRTAMQLFWGHFTGGQLGISPFNPGYYENAEIEINFAKNQILKYTINMSLNDHISESIDFFNVSGPTTESFTFLRENWTGPNEMKSFLSKRMPTPVPRFPRMVRLDPDSLRTPGGLIPSSQQIDMQNEKGIDLASIYDALINNNLDGFLSIRKKISALFPTVSNVTLKNVRIDEEGSVAKMLELELKNGTRVPSQFMSEGVLYYLAFAALQYLEPASILLVEEPENGLHPSRIKEIMTILREISETTQVLIATHSPLVINELKKDEVSVVWRDDEKGTMVMPIRETADFKDRSKVYSLGELWLSYADGIKEEILRMGAK